MQSSPSSVLMDLTVLLSPSRELQLLLPRGVACWVQMPL